VRPARFFIALTLVLGVLSLGGTATADDDTRPARPSSPTDPAQPSASSDKGPATSSQDDHPALRPSALQAGQRYEPRPGVVFNTALGGAASRNAIFGKIIAAINHAPGGSRIRIMSWNIMSRTAVDALLRAQRRGVKIRVLMDNTNLVDIPNPGFRRLKASFKRYNQQLGPKKRSYAKTCMGSCRGARGAAHSKIYLFSKTGSAHDVVMSGSANLTVAGAVNQWNDMYTWVDNRKLFNFAVRVYSEMWKDKPVEQQYITYSTGKDLLGFTPLIGPGGRTEDPIQRLLSKVTCRGARNTRHGRTVIRAAPDVMRNDRGMAIALRLRDLWAQGCDVRIAYTVMGVDIFRALNQTTARGRVPKKHLVQDFDGDGEFDNYFHLKALTINGHWNGNRGAYVTLNGSSNWSGFAAVSDENFGILKRRAPTMKYQKFIDYWYVNFPKSEPVDERVLMRVARGEVNPYAHVDMD
jgi:phosphatidylserine/phosphatidylglycerophosphate/cardiolipin synthase-like enzyme